jgi:hypothetical protein
MVKWTAFLLVFLCSCASTPTEDTKMNVIIKNATDQDIILKAGNGMFMTAVRIKPGESWKGLVDRRFFSSSSFIVIEKP